MSRIKIIALMEDNLCGNGLEAEHGLSIYIETPKHKLLVDTGQSGKTWANATAKGIDITRVDTVFLSHGHYDHSGGLMNSCLFLQMCILQEIGQREIKGCMN